MKALRLLAPLMAAALVLSGCNVIKINPDRDGAQIVAVVNGENITKKQVYDYCNEYMGTNYQPGQQVDVADADTFKSNKQTSLDDMIADKITKLKANDAGMYTFTADDQNEIDSDVSSYYQSTYDTALAKYQEQAKTDPSINPEDKAMADVDAYLASEGTSRDQLRTEAEDSVAQEKLYKSVTDSVTPADTDIQNEYNTELSDQQTTFDASDTSVIPTENGSSTGSPETIVYYPNDTFFRVRQILIPIPSDIESKITADRQTNTDASNSEANQLRDDALKTLLDKANSAYTQAVAANGDLTKLDQLIKYFGDNDPGMDTLPDGYLMSPDSKTDYDPSWTAAAIALTTIGQPSKPVGTDYGYSIIWITKKIAKGAVPLDQVKTQMTAAAKASMQNDAWENAVYQWVFTDYKAKIQENLGRLNN